MPQSLEPVATFLIAWLGSVVLAAATFAAEPVSICGATMGTTYQVKLASVPVSVDVTKLAAAVAATLSDVDARMSTYRSDSEVCRFNRTAADEWFPVSAATAKVVAAAQEVSRQSDGALDVTVGPLVRLWHFGPKKPTGGDSAADFTPPPDEALAALHGAVGYAKLAVRRDPPALRKRIGQLEIDLSAIAKGYAVDCVAELIADRGIANYMVEIGGEVRAGGKRNDGRPWRVGVERPLDDRHELEAAVPLADAAMATSGDYRNFFQYAGRRYSHIIDPRTGRPVEHTLASVSVAAADCMLADAWATALLVLGPQHGYECAERHGIAALLISRENGTGVTQTTTAWKTTFGTN